MGMGNKEQSGVSRKISAASARAHTRIPKQSTPFQLPSDLYSSALSLFHSPLSFEISSVMVPVNYTNGTLEHSNLTYSNIDKLSTSNIPTRSHRYFSEMCHQTLTNQLVSLWSILSWSSKQNWLDYYQLKYARNQSKRPSVKTGFLGLSGKSADTIDFYTSEIERLSKEMLVDDIGDVTITNDGAIILKMLDVEHPAAKVEEYSIRLAELQDREVGNGTTSVVIMSVK